MANEQNLRIPTSKEARAIGKRGGIASGEARRKKRDIRLALEALLEHTYVDEVTGKKLSGAEIISLRQMERAMVGDAKSFELVRDSVGQKPVEKIMVSEVEPSVIAEVEQAVLDD